MRKQIIAATVAAFGVATLSAAFIQDSITAASTDTSAPLTAADILVDAALVPGDPAARDIENPHASEPIVAEQLPTDNAAEPQPVPAVAIVEEIPPAASLAELVAAQDGSAPLDPEMRCLAGAVYHESKGESLAGQLAVAKVIIARSQSGRFPASLCGVVKQRSQFSFVRGGVIPTPPANRQWRTALAISRIALADGWDSPVEGALYFHARHVSPGWRLSRLGNVDNHVFYR